MVDLLVPGKAEGIYAVLVPETELLKEDKVVLAENH